MMRKHAKVDRATISGAAFALVMGMTAGITVDAAASGPAIDMFTISLEEMVEPGVPGPGAGEIETPGAVDIYEFNASAGQTVFFQTTEWSSAALNWRCFDPTGDELFSSGISSDAGTFELTETGTYSLEVLDFGTATGTYSFIIWETTTDTTAISIESPVSGDIDEPGDIDLFTFTASSGQSLFFQSTDWESAALNWRCFAPSGDQLFQAGISSSNGPFELTESGTYTVQVLDFGDAVGTFSFTVWETNTDSSAIALETLVSGEIEDPGDNDLYTFSGTAGQSLFFQTTEWETAALNWRCFDPNGDQLFQSGISSDRGPFELTESGTYTLEFRDFGAATGTYSFIVWETNTDTSAISLETLVEGEIEDPGDNDFYTFTATAGQNLFFQTVDWATAALNWRCFDPNGDEVFATGISNDRGPFAMKLTGTYTIEVLDFGDAIGTYSLIVWETDDDAFSIGLNEKVDVDMPGSGAGLIEDPGNFDRYTIDGNLGDVWCFKPLEFETAGLNWRLLNPSGDIVWQSGISTDHADTVLDDTGPYVIEVFDLGDLTGTYSFIVTGNSPADLNDDCLVGFNDLLILLAAWGPCPDGEDCEADFNDDTDVGFADLLVLLANWSNA